MLAVMTDSAPSQRRIAGISVKPAGETRYCQYCKQEATVWKSVPVSVMGKQYIQLFCGQCEKPIGGYPLKTSADEKPKELGQPTQAAAPKYDRTTPLTAESPMPFGTYGPFKGDPRKMKDVPKGYLATMAGQEWLSQWPALKQYIEANRAAIEKEV